MSFKPMVKTGNDPQWYGNSLAFATQEEAELSARDLMNRWLLVVECCAQESDEPVNAEIKGGVFRMLSKEELNAVTS